MEAWPLSKGEALHTQTFLGHPPGCAAALASMAVIEREGLVPRAAELGRTALARLREALGSLDAVVDVRGLGLMLGIEFDNGDLCATVVRECLQGGVIALPSGRAGEVLSLTPPLSIDPGALDYALGVIIAACPNASLQREIEEPSGAGS
jgi:4-aminobutyrate aminotransferase-like enzyme